MPRSVAWLFAALALSFSAALLAEDTKLKLTLVWGTDDEKLNVSNFKKADDHMVKGIKKFNKYFFEVTNITTTVSGKMSKIRLSPKCEVEFKNLEKGAIEAKLIGEGKVVYTQSGVIPAGEHLVLGGDDPKNATAWFVFLTPQSQPQK